MKRAVQNGRLEVFVVVYSFSDTGVLSVIIVSIKDRISSEFC